ncbi:MAG TPA: site-specific DNA-methyltransferase [Solirubrobacterales bacterium]|nr:site-specific DNA-methyltransferase [Solirubrobacterales bacterium]
MSAGRDRSPSTFWTLHRHDARELDGLFDHRSNGDSPTITATITSPPYGALKDYGVAGQIGHGQAYEEYLGDMGDIFDAIFRRTADDGSLWLIADTYMAKGPAPRKLLPVPFDLATVAEDRGWTLRDVIIWQKDRTLPWSNGTRLRNAFEYVLLLVKGPDPKYRLGRLREHLDLKDWWVRFPERYNPEGKAPSNVWNIPIPKQGSWGRGEIAHACPLPPELVERLILLSSDEGDVVFDPFAGSGVVVAEAERLGRRGIGTELVKRHIDEFARIIRPEILARAKAKADKSNGSSANAELLVKLRMLKLPVVLMRAAARRRQDVAWPAGALVLPSKSTLEAGKFGAAEIYFIVDNATDGQRRSYEESVTELQKRPPGSKFGIQAQLHVISSAEAEKVVAGRKIFVYRNGSTSRAGPALPHKQIGEKLEASTGDSVPPVLSSLFVDVAPRPDSAVYNGARP